jgi:uncharacterized membrane protein YphA (DoxX/SURF4 family)
MALEIFACPTFIVVPRVEDGWSSRLAVFERSNGFSWAARGYEFTLMWGLLLFAVALRGGGPYSLDRLLGRQL